MITHNFVLKQQKLLQKRLNKSTSGFTVLEILVVVIMVGILASLSGAGLLGWLNRQRVTAARDAISSAIYDAKSRAQQRGATWQASFRQTTVNGKTVVQWAVHPANTTNPTWINIEQSSGVVEIVTTNPDTTLTTTGNPNGAWKIQFDNKGNVPNDITPIGRITLSNPRGANKRCVQVKTILGAVGVGLDSDCTKS